ncbi:MAG TPA: hypothetical protein VGJ04_12540 [Pirellulales bacterium]|jgi:hypothetical protein
MAKQKPFTSLHAEYLSESAPKRKLFTPAQRRMLIDVARHFATVTGVFLIAMVLIAWRHGTLNVVSIVRESLLNVETALREWFNCLRNR